MQFTPQYRYKAIYLKSNKYIYFVYIYISLIQIYIYIKC